MRLHLFAMLAMAVPASAEAAIKTYAFSGVVETTLFPGTIDIGDVMSGTMSFDTGATETIFTNTPNAVAYGNAVTAMRFTFPKIKITYTGPDHPLMTKAVTVTDESGAARDRLKFEIDNNDPFRSPFTVEGALLSIGSLSIELTALDGSALSSTALPGTIDLSQFTNRRFNVFGPPTSGRLTSFEELPSIAPKVPEPATWAMMIAGFGLAGAAVRRRAPGRVVPA